MRMSLLSIFRNHDGNNEDTLFLLAGIIFLAQMLRYGVAFQAAEPPFIAWGIRFDISPLTGLAFGIGYEAIALYALRESFSALKRGVKRWFLPLISASLQIVVGVLIITPAIVAQLRNVVLSQILGVAGCWIWSVIIALAPAISLISVALTLATIKSFRPSVADFASSDAQRRSQRIPATLHDAFSDAQHRFQQDAATLHDAQRRSQQDAASLDSTGHGDDKQELLYVCSCGFSTSNRYQYAGHLRSCKRNGKAVVENAVSSPI